MTCCKLLQQVFCLGLCVKPLVVQEFLVPEVDNAGDFNAAGRPYCKK